MKKVSAILIASILLISGLQISIDRHYCGGELAGIKLSFTGRMATCGMEENDRPCSGPVTINKKCCEDQVTFYSVSGKYIPESFRMPFPVTVKDLPSLPTCDVLVNQSHIAESGSWVLPPGDPLSSFPPLSLICVYRI